MGTPCAEKNTCALREPSPLFLSSSESYAWISLSIRLAMARTYPGRWYQDGITVCLSGASAGSSRKIFSSSRSEEPEVETENCG